MAAGDLPTSERERLARAYRSVPDLVARMTLEEAVSDATVRRLLLRVADSQDKPRRRAWGRYFASSTRT